MLCGFIVSRLARYFIPFIVHREYKTASMMRLMFQPYGRIFHSATHRTAGKHVPGIGGGKVFVLVFALVKIFVEVYMNFDNILNKTMEGIENKNTDDTDKTDLHR